MFKQVFNFIIRHSLEFFSVSFIAYSIYCLENRVSPLGKNISYTMTNKQQKICKEEIIKFYKDNGIKNVILEIRNEELKISYNSLKIILPPSEFLGKVSKVKISTSLFFKKDFTKCLYYFSIFLLVFSYLFIRKEKFKISDIFNKNNKKVIILSISFLFIFSFFYPYLIKIIFNKEIEPYSSILIKSLERNIFLQIYVIIIAPISEEIYFRAYVFNRAKKYFRDSLFAFIVASIIFAICHFSLIYLVYYYIVGYFLCFIYAKSNSILMVIFLHILNNLIYWLLV